MLKDLFTRLEKIYPELVEIRRDLHMYPELSHQEVNTPKKIADYLTKLGMEVQTNVGGRGVVGILRGGKPGKTVALRADFDALPIQEETDVEYKSRIPGVMHACGHDLHTAALLGVAKVFSENKENIPGTIKFIHQFGEEVTPGGAKPMIEDGCLEGVDVMYGAHVMSTSPLGTVAVKEGYFSSAQDDFEIVIFGKGGHGSQPHLTVDPIVTGSQLVVNLQQIVSRRVNPQHAAVLTVGAFNSGEANNIIPDKAVIKGTVRTYDEEARELIAGAMEQVTKLTCASNGAEVDFQYIRDCPSIFNNPEETKRVADIARLLVGEENLDQNSTMMGSEDFAYYSKEVPSVYFLVGGGNSKNYPHHHPKFNVDERAMIEIGKMFISTTLNYLTEGAIKP